MEQPQKPPSDSPDVRKVDPPAKRGGLKILDKISIESWDVNPHHLFLDDDLER